MGRERDPGAEEGVGSDSAQASASPALPHSASPSFHCLQTYEPHKTCNKSPVVTCQKPRGSRNNQLLSTFKPALKGFTSHSQELFKAILKSGPQLRKEGSSVAKESEIVFRMLTSSIARGQDPCHWKT